MKNCASCSFPELDDSSYCSMCGKPLARQSPALLVPGALTAAVLLLFLALAAIGFVTKVPSAMVAGVVGAVISLPPLRPVFRKLQPEFATWQLYGIWGLAAMLGLSGFFRTPPLKEEDAQRAGFASLAEMRALNGRGYNTMAEYREAKARDLAFFARCYKLHGKEYEADCKGRRVSWKAIYESSGYDGARVRLINDDGTRNESEFSVDVPGLKRKLDEDKDKGKAVVFDGVLGRRNTVYPDVDDAVLVSIETDAERTARDTRNPKPRDGTDRFMDDITKYRGLASQLHDQLVASGSAVGAQECWDGMQKAYAMSWDEQRRWPHSYWASVASRCNVYQNGKLLELD